MAYVADSTLDRIGRLKLEVVGPHAGRQWKVVVLVGDPAIVITIHEVRAA